MRMQKSIAAFALTGVFLGVSGPASAVDGPIALGTDVSNGVSNGVSMSVSEYDRDGVVTLTPGGQGNTATADRGELIPPGSDESVTLPGGSGGSRSCSVIYEGGHYPTASSLKDIDLDKSCPEAFKTDTGSTAYRILPFPCPCR